MGSVIEFRDVVKSYGSIQALKGVTFNVPEGVLASLVGPNGAGKTTTLRLAVGALRRDYGVVRVFGEDPWLSPERVRSLTGYLPENPSLPSVTVRRLLMHVARLKGVGRPEREVARVSRLTGITSVLGLNADKLSAGWRQRVALSVALVGEPKLLLLDEPASNLDPLARSRFYDLINRLSSDYGLTALISTHILAEAREYTNYMIVLLSGLVMVEGSIKDLASRVKTVVEVVFKGKNVKALRTAAKEALSVEGVLGAIIEGQLLKVRVRYDVLEKVREVIEGLGLMQVEVKPVDLTKLYEDLLKGSAG